MKISIVIPALNEEAGIGSAIDQIPVAKLNNMGYEVEIVIVDNGSTDKTAEIAIAHGARIVAQSLRGYGNAYKTGFSSVTGDIIVTGDGDVSYPFDAIPELLAEFQQKNLDFLNTDRLSKLDPKTMTISHIFGNWLLSKIARNLFSWPFRDSQSGMWIFKRNIWPHLDVQSGGMAFSQELKIEAFTKGFNCAEMPIAYRSRVGKVKLSTIKDGIFNTMQLFKKRFAKRKQNIDSKHKINLP